MRAGAGGFPVVSPPAGHAKEHRHVIRISRHAVTPSVRAVHAKMGADRIWQDFKSHREFGRFTEDEVAFIADRDSFYIATVSETG